MWLLINNLLFANDAGPTEAQAHIMVEDSRYEEIYFEEPRVMCEVPCSFEQDTSSIFVEANRKHKTWLKSGKVTGVYNDETIKYAYDDCNFKLNPHGCANENGVWVMRTTISVTADRASINIMLFDENAAMIGQGTFTRFKKTRVIERKKVTQQQIPGAAGSISQCNKADGSCATIPFQGNGRASTQTEDLEPVVIDIPPTLTARDIGQTMIYVYDSVR
jgi:hypothetical protein